MTTLIGDQQTRSMDQKSQNPDTKIRQLVRVRQPEELLIRPETERLQPKNPANLDYNLRSPVTSVTAEQLSKALENLKTNIRQEKESGEFQHCDETVQEGEFEHQVDVDDVGASVGEQAIASLGKSLSSLMTASPPKQTFNTGNKGRTVSCIIWVHLQASICTEWEQNSMVLTPGTNIGARVTANPVQQAESSPPAIVTSQVSPNAEFPAPNPNQKKPKTIHRCILQRATKSRSHEASLVCHVCNGSYHTYDAYFNHLIDATCVKNQTARLASPTVRASAVEPKLVQCATADAVDDDDDDDDVRIDAEFYRVPPIERPMKATTTSTTASMGSITSVTTTTSSSMSTSSISSIVPLAKAVKRGRPPKLNLESSVGLPVFLSSPPLSATKRALQSPGVADAATGPLNLSKRPALDIPRASTTEVDMPPLVPIRRLVHFANAELLQRRDVLGSAGSGGDISSTETTPSGKDFLSDQSDVFTERMTGYSSTENEFPGQNVAETFRAKSVTTKEARIPGLEDLTNISEDIRLRRLSEDVSPLRATFNPATFQILPTRKRSSDVAVFNYCPHLATATMPPISLDENVTDQMSPKLSQTQLKFQFLRHEIFVAKTNVERFLKAVDPIKFELNGWSKKPVEVVLNEIISIQLANKDYNKNLLPK